jgi:hypothetical protein
VFNGKAMEWKDMGGHHLSSRSFDLLKDRNIEVLVIGNGVNGVVNVTASHEGLVKSMGIRKLIVQRTPWACSTYNELYKKGKKVALLAHGTC